MVKATLIGMLLAAPLASTAQKEYTPTERELRMSTAPTVNLYTSLKDTAAKPALVVTTRSAFYSIGQTQTPRWLAVDYKGKEYFTLRSNLEPSLKEGMAQLRAGNKKPAEYSTTTPTPVSRTLSEKEAALDAKNGFREMHFGDNVSKFTDLVKLEGTGTTIYYKRKAENLKIGEAALKEISYGFYKGKLSFILIQTTGLVNSRAVLDALTAQYGPGFKQNKFIEKYYWSGNVVSLLYDENLASHDANISFSSKAIEEQRRQDKGEAAKKAASDL